MPKSKSFNRKIIFEGTQNFYQCNNCNKIYGHELGLKLHKKFCPFASKIILSETTSFQCVRCSLVFDNAIEMREHVLKKHKRNWRETLLR